MDKKKDMENGASMTHALKTSCGNLYVTVTKDKKVILQMAKAGGCTSAWLETTSELVTLLLQSGISIEKIAETIGGIKCNSPYWNKGKNNMDLSCSDIIAKYLKTNKDWIEKKIFSK